nr:FAD-dependent oxidoreductase [Mycoplasmopsis bovis]
MSASLAKLGFTLQRLKTGTPPRIYSDSINFDEVEQEVLSDVNISFSSRSNLKMPKQIACYLTYTTPETHKIILRKYTSFTNVFRSYRRNWS